MKNGINNKAEGTFEEVLRVYETIEAFELEGVQPLYIGKMNQEARTRAVQQLMNDLHIVVSAVSAIAKDCDWTYVYVPRLERNSGHTLFTRLDLYDRERNAATKLENIITAFFPNVKGVRNRRFEDDVSVVVD